MGEFAHAKVALWRNMSRPNSGGSGWPLWADSACWASRAGRSNSADGASWACYSHGTNRTYWTDLSGGAIGTRWTSQSADVSRHRPGGAAIAADFLPDIAARHIKVIV